MRKTAWRRSGWSALLDTVSQLTGIPPARIMRDSREIAFTPPVRDFVKRLGQTFETELAQRLLRHEMQAKLSARELEIRECHHRIKNQFNLLISTLKTKA